MSRTLSERERAVAAIEGTVAERERSVHDREQAAHLRDETASPREEALRAREEAGLAKADTEARVMAQLREANQNLLLATVHAQTMTEAAERINREKEQFLAMLAHELRNPLAPIVNALAVLRRIATPEPLLPWAHDVIKRQVEHMTRLLNDLLDVSRITSGKIALQKRPVTITEFALQAIETARPLIADRKQRLDIDLPPEPLTVDGDPARLTQVFSNLLINAAKYTQEGGVIRFSAQQQGGVVLMRVADNGGGIARESLPNIFELFTQEDRSLAHAQGGLGIGLTVVRRVVEMHGGAVVATSAGEGEGSEFTVTLPLIANPAEALPFDAEHSPAATPAPNSRVVIIEDNLDASESLKMLLQIMGWEVFTAFDGAGGVAAVQAHRPQIVLCDIGLPGMDGYAVAARLREEHAKPLPVMIALTGYGQPEDRDRASKAGFDHHLVKPVDPDDLLRLIAMERDRTSRIRQAADLK